MTKLTKKQESLLNELLEDFKGDTVHQVRNSLKYVTWKDRKRVAAGLRAIYTAPTVEAAGPALEKFAEEWGEQYPAIAPTWKRNWERLTLPSSTIRQRSARLSTPPMPLSR